MPLLVTFRWSQFHPCFPPKEDTQAAGPFSLPLGWEEPSVPCCRPTGLPIQGNPKGFPGPAPSQWPPDFRTKERCSRSEADLLHPHDRHLLWATGVVNTAVPCLRPGPVDSELTAN